MITLTEFAANKIKTLLTEKEETGKCFIKYPLLMKCNYQNVKQKTGNKTPCYKGRW